MVRQGYKYMYLIWEANSESTREGVGKLRRNERANVESMTEWVTSMDNWDSLPLGIFWETMLKYFSIVLSHQWKRKLGYLPINFHPSLVQLLGILGYLASKMTKPLWHWRKPSDRETERIDTWELSLMSYSSPKGPPFQVRIQHMIFGGTHNTQSIAFCLWSPQNLCYFYIQNTLIHLITLMTPKILTCFSTNIKV